MPKTPTIISFVRDDGGVYAGAEVSIFYDPMISKLAAWGRTRAEAIERLRRALGEYTVGGIKTTLPFFREVTRDEEFIAGRLDTGFIERYQQRQRAARVNEIEDEPSTEQRDIAVIVAALAATDERETQASEQRAIRDSTQTFSRWRLAGRGALHNSRNLS